MKDGMGASGILQELQELALGLYLETGGSSNISPRLALPSLGL